MGNTATTRRYTRAATAVLLLATMLVLIPGTPGRADDPPLPDPADHLLITEFAVSPTAGEFIEIFNPTASTITLTNVYLTDATFAGGNTYYYNIVTGANAGGGGFGDFHAIFPEGAEIGAGEYQTVALPGSDSFTATYGVDPTYELWEDGDGSDGIPEMLEATPGSINNQGGLSDNGEVVVIYEWAGESDLVDDLDYVVWGDKNEAVDKTGVAIDGPDPDSDTSTYLDDLATAIQDGLAPDGVFPAGGDSWQRRDLSEGAETKTGGNGISDNNEMTENMPFTWGETAATPNEATTLDPPDPGGGGGPGPLPDPGVCGDEFTPIYEIQGDTDESPKLEDSVNTQGVVTGTFPDISDGFYIQDPVGDGDADTSDGIYVDFPVGSLTLGQAVRVTGHVDEFFGLTQITTLTEEAMTVQVCEGGATVDATLVSLPVAEDFEPYESMFVVMPKMTATDVFGLSRFGEVVVSQPDRLFQPTDVVLPGAGNAELTDLNNRNSLILDDASAEQNPEPVPFIDSNGTLRVGSMADDLTGIVTCNFGCHKLEPTEDVDFYGAPRPNGPGDVGGDLKVASFNVLNYWTTLNDGTNPGARGANSASELERQTHKLVAAINKLDADIVGLQELENNGDVAISALVDALNAADTGVFWDYVDDVDYPGGIENTNAIKVGIIYQTGSVTPIGDPMTSLDEDFATDRPPVAQQFMWGEEEITVMVNHFKSKSCSGTGPGEANEDEADVGDGQVCYNPRRTRQAEAAIDFVDDIVAETGDPDVLVIGDLNSYALEDPTRTLRKSLVDLTQPRGSSDAYSFVFFGQSGQLDYAFATRDLAAKVTGIDTWHINVDEPPFLDYNEEFKPAGSFNPDEFRSSDHDPVIVGIGTESALSNRGQLNAVIDDLAEIRPTGDATDDELIGRASGRLKAAREFHRWVDSDNGAKGRSILKRIRRAVYYLEQVSTVSVDGQIVDLADLSRDIATIGLDLAGSVDGDAALIAEGETKVAEGDVLLAGGDPRPAIGHYRSAWGRASKAASTPTFATYNASLNRGSEGQLMADLATGDNAQAKVIAEIIQHADPDVVLVNEFDYDSGGVAARGFRDNYLAVDQGTAEAAHYPYIYVAESNTGIPSGRDFDKNGTIGGPGDAFGFGFFPGQYGMVVYSKYPIHYNEVRTFQNFLWDDMPGAMLPVDPATGPWYDEGDLEIFRLSSKSHWDVPVWAGEKKVHFLTSHPTPPVFDGPEDRNGTRNHDEIRFWADYVDSGSAGYIYDDKGKTGGMEGSRAFVIAGDQNSDPFDGDSVPGSAQQLTEHPGINNTVIPASLGGPEQALLQGGANDDHIGDPAYDTADFSSPPGNLRVDYVLPSRNLDIIDSEVFWPLTTDPLFPLVGVWPFPSSDHKLVWVLIDTM